MGLIKMFDKLYIKEAIVVLRDILKDIDKWSVHNDDVINEEVNEIKKLLEQIKEKTTD